MINKKATMAPAVLLLTLAIALMLSLAMVAFYKAKTNADENLSFSKDVEELYKEEIKLNFLIKNIVENAAKGERDEEAFLNKMKLELEKYKSPAGNYLNVPELEQVESQLKAENIIEKEGNFTLKLNLTVKHQENDEYATLLESSYSYGKDFITSIPFK